MSSPHSNPNQGNTIIVQKALGQQNIDDLLKLSEEYKKSKPVARPLNHVCPRVLNRIPGELEVVAARSRAGDVVEECEEVVKTTVVTPAPSVARAPTVIVDPPAPATEVVKEVKETIIRDVSPARSCTSHTTSTMMGDEMTVALVEGHRSRRGSVGSSRDIRQEIRHLERQLARRERGGSRSERDIVKAERLSSGELVLYEERVERVEEPSRGVRIEKDKKGRMSISVPKYR